MSVRISASLKRDRNQFAVREIVGSCVFGYFPFVSSRGRGLCRPDGQGGSATRGTWVRDEKVPKIPEVILALGCLPITRRHRRVVSDGQWRELRGLERWV